MPKTSLAPAKQISRHLGAAERIDQTFFELYLCRLVAINFAQVAGVMALQAAVQR